MQTLNVSIEINGVQTPAGVIIGNDSSDAQFYYDSSYMRNGLPISISLPFQTDGYSPEKTRNFFEGLLPEGFTRRSVAQWIQTDENDYISILKTLGNECLGAIRISGSAASVERGYDKLSIEQVRALAAEGATKSTEILVKTHLSLAGASGKVGLYYNSKDKEWYLPKGLSPSTHIVKQSHVRLKNVVINEQLCLLTASKLGIEIPESFIINTGAAKDEDILFATKRFDRSLSEIVRKDGFAIPLRLHQEDFAQALGISSQKKYEDSHSAYLKQMMETLRKYSCKPMDDILKLWRIICFNWLIGNTDAHLKNNALVYASNMKSIRLAPAYDIMSTVIYNESTRNMSFRIGDARAIDEINRNSFAAAAFESGTNKKTVLSILDKLCDGFESAIKEASYELSEQGFQNVLGIREAILMSGGFAAVNR